LCFFLSWVLQVVAGMAKYMLQANNHPTLLSISLLLLSPVLGVAWGITLQVALDWDSSWSIQIQACLFKWYVNLPDHWGKPLWP
jgi:hypothetical protein